MNQHPIFTKYTRAWLSEITGYTRGHLSRIATGNLPLSRCFIERVSHRLNQPAEDLFLLKGQCLLPGCCGEGSLGQWLQEKCQDEHLSLRQASIRVGISHATIADIISGTRPLPETIQKLAIAFGGEGTNGRQALEDHLMVLAGYRRSWPQEKLSEPLAQVVDKLKQFNEPQLKVMSHFADYVAEISNQEK